ncbi:site-specific DNA-methyltransferase (plasmid) [Lactiplantibacillus plantarum]|nr:site-specific DNA-methyltransferase [Lactiplantibacillus plantarum]
MMDKENIRDFNNKSSFDMVSEAHRKLMNLFPEIESDGKIDFERLKLLVSDDEVESTERFGLNWAGKEEAIKTAQSRTSSTLRPIMGDSVDWDETQNLYIEGDNLEILKVIQRSYADSIKLIYLDPPYNTGKDFVYRDNTTQATDDYLEVSGQKGEFAYSTNVETNGRFHSTWLSMMYPRLKLVRSLLQDDGVLFVSIDDTEVDNLRKIMDEIFGESNFIAQIIVDGTPKNDPLIVATSHEYILVYTKNKAEAKLTQWGAPNPLTDELNELVNGAESYAEAEERLKKYFKDNNLQKDNISNYKYVDEKGIFRTGPLDDPQSRGPKDERINIKTGNPLKVPSRGWSSNVQTWNEWVDAGLIYFPDDDDKLPGKKLT